MKEKDLWLKGGYAIWQDMVSVGQVLVLSDCYFVLCKHVSTYSYKLLNTKPLQQGFVVTMHIVTLKNYTTYYSTIQGLT